jgi:diaminopimelate epimerase
MTIPFTKAHGAKNDFLLTWAADAPAEGLDRIAVSICDRHTGAGADGWMLVSTGVSGADGAIRLFNADGSEPELSGNGTRCAAAFLIDAGKARNRIRIATGAGLKEMTLLERSGRRYMFEMNMGTPEIAAQNLQYALPTGSGPLDATILNVGNPQCAIFARPLPPNWRAIGAEVERHSLFPNRTNVSFVTVVDSRTVDVRFFERGVGETMSSGTGSTGAAAAAVARGLVESPVTVCTPAGTMTVRWNGGDAWLTGPAEIVAKGEFYL